MQIMRCRPKQHRLAIHLVAMTALCICMPGVSAQTSQTAPVTDSSAQASPLRRAPPAPATDSAAQASPAPGIRTGGVRIAPHTAVPVKLATPIDSGHLTNGQTVHATLAAPVPLSRSGTLPAGTPVALTVIETIPAGRISAAGEFSLQALQVGSVPVYTDTLTYRGQPGHKDVPDAAPAVGTDAGLPAGAELIFHVLPPATPATGPPRTGRAAPGSIDGVSSGSRPPSQPQGQATPAANT